MPSATLHRDFTRELSVWQQEIEIEANHFIFPEVLGISCTSFFIANKDGIASAYRLENEYQRLPGHYAGCMRRPHFAKKIYTSAHVCRRNIKSIVQKLNKQTTHATSAQITDLRNNLMAIWPAYLFGYNILRYQEKGLYRPKTKTEKQNMVWATKLHYLLEGIYDLVEDSLGRVMAPIMRKAKRPVSDWRQMGFLEILRATDQLLVSRRSPAEFVLDQFGRHNVTLKQYAHMHHLGIPRETKRTSMSLRGKTAQSGTASGRVRIVHKGSHSDIAAFRSGEILVAMVVGPTFLPAIKKAKAIITDSGGLVSHAAIAAREFGIPCVVGTTYATKILKNGDQVSVDATRGIIKKISRSTH